MTTATGQVALRPHDGPQEDFLSSPADIVIGGGGAGGGKTFALLIEALRHVTNTMGWTCVCFRRTYPMITNPGGLWDESHEIYSLFGGESREDPLEWEWKQGGVVRFAHMQREKDRLAWKGAQIGLLMFDQLEEFTEEQFWYLLSRNRSISGPRPYVRATCNPVPPDDKVGGWLARLISWWWNPDTGYAIPERAGKVRWFIRIENELIWADSEEELEAKYPGHPPRSLTFVPMSLDDNPTLVKGDPQYRATLLSLPLVDRERLLKGNWKIRPSAGNVFRREWFEIVDAVPATGVVRCRGWDKAATMGAGDWTAGVRLAKTSEGEYIVEDARRAQLSAGQRDKLIRQTAELDGHSVTIVGEEEPGSAGKSDSAAFIKLLSGFIVHTVRPSGDKVIRAGPASAQAEAGNIKLLRGAWNEAFLDELESFPDGGHDDQVDGFAHAFNHLNTEIFSVQIGR